MAHKSSSGIVSPLVYPQVSKPGFGRWFIACWVGVIGGAFVVFPIVAIVGIVEWKAQVEGSPAFFGVLLAFFFLVGLGVLTAAVAIVLHREHIEIDLRTRTVTRRRSWGPIRRTIVLPGEVAAVRLMHNTHSTSGGKGGNYDSRSSYTVCALKLVTRQGDFWQLSERPEAKETLRAWMLPSFVRRALTVGGARTQMRVAINGLPVSFFLRPAAEDDPKQVRYEFIVDRRKQFGYVPADLLGIFRRDGLVGVVYDPHQPDVHLPLPVIERYLTFE